MGVVAVVEVKSGGLRRVSVSRGLRSGEWSVQGIVVVGCGKGLGAGG